MELPISTLDTRGPLPPPCVPPARILKVTQFHRTVSIVCETGLPVRLYAPIGGHQSHVNVYIQPEPSTAAHGEPLGTVDLMTHADRWAPGS